MTTANSWGTPQKTVKRTNRPNQETRKLWEGIIAIVNEPDFARSVLTTRQIYYQCVVRGFIDQNSQAQYDRVQRAVLQMRRQDAIPWAKIRDGHRERITWRTYNELSAALEDTAQLYRRNVMRSQPIHLELWIEKDSLAGWLRPLAMRYGIPYAALRGFSSDGFQFDAAEEWRDLGRPVVVIYAGDFDPSGWTIATDLEAHLQYFYDRVTVQHIGLHSQQIRMLDLPPSFEAKKSDSRTPAFVRQFGTQCTELDAVPPNILQQWYENTIRSLVDIRELQNEWEHEYREKQQLADMINNGLRGVL